jgi:hypothetical protein
MNWTPKTEEELMEEKLCPKGKAPFTIMSAEPARSKSGSDMIKLKLNVHADDGFDYHVYDYISPAWMEHKFRHFWYAIGLGNVYESGNGSTELLQGREGWCDVGRDKGKDGFAPKETVVDYLPQNSAKIERPPAPKSDTATADNDDVPF